MKKLKVLNQYKKSFFLLLTICLLLALLQSCNSNDDIMVEGPIAKFEIMINEANPLEVTFINKSENASFYSWNLGDGTVSTEESLLHIYEKEGEYEVSLIARSETDASDISRTLSITVPERYVDEMFSNVVQSNGSYGSFAINRFELLKPEGDTETKRPLILLSPGGNFSSFTRSDKLKGMCESLAKRGYVAAIINYAQIEGSTGGKLQDFSDLFVKGVRDQRSAIRYFRKNAEQYGIDPNKIFIGGWSTGASLAFATAYMDLEDIEDLPDSNVVTAMNESLNKFGGLDNDDNTGVSSQANGAIIIMGYTFDVSMLDSNIPLLMINHEKAVTVNDCQSFTDEISIALSDVSVKVYGTNLIFEEAKKSGLIEDNNLKYILQDNWENGWRECDWYPNVSTLTSHNHSSIALFLSQNL